MKYARQRVAAFSLLVVLLAQPADLFAQTPADHSAGDGPTAVRLKSWADEASRLRDRDRLRRQQQLLPGFEAMERAWGADLTKSALLPGLSQIRNGHSWRGASFMAAYLGAIGLGTWQLIESNKKYDLYKSATNIDDIERRFDDSSRFLKRSGTIYAAAGVILVANLVDAGRTTKAYNRSVWRKFEREAGGDRVSLIGNAGAGSFALAVKVRI